jgi:hypothetical protein
MRGAELVDDWVKILVPLVSVLVTGGLAVFRYWQDSKWKRREFIASEVRRFYASEAVGQISGIIGWLGIAKPGSPSAETLTGILRSTLLETAPGIADAKLRDAVHAYFFELGFIDDEIQSGLFAYKDIEPYLSWELAVLTGTTGKTGYDTRTAFIGAVKDYLRYWNYQSTERLLQRHQVFQAKELRKLPSGRIVAAAT